MNIVLSDRFRRSYVCLSQSIQRRVDQKLGIFLANPRHPSLRVKRLQGHEGLWEGSITMNYRFVFTWIGKDAYIVDVGPHKLVDRL